jgi:hypothetical protein
MPRSISDREIALIKAMLHRRMKNKDIQFFFNRPNRSVNAGRISQIASGTYSDSSTIEPASEPDLVEFVSTFEATDFSASIAVPSSTSRADPMDAQVLQNMFTKESTGVWRFQCGETDEHECKLNFRIRSEWLRPVAALANNRGGYILFGVKDKGMIDGSLDPDSYKVLGLRSPDFVNADPADFSKQVKATFDPTPRIESAVLKLGELKVGVLYVHQHPSRPVIAVKNEGEVKEGDIYYRYPGQSARIKYSDLRSILDQRDSHARAQILPMVEKLLKLGPDNAMIADLSGGFLSNEKQSIVIGKDLLDQIKFIRDGEFDEVAGAPTLRLVGDVKAVDVHGAVIRKGFATSADLIDDFLCQNPPVTPLEYIRCAVEGGILRWLPIHYYARQAKLNGKELAAFIMRTRAQPQRKVLYKERALGIKSAFQPATGKNQMTDKFRNGELPKPETVKEATAIARAIMGLKRKPSISFSDIAKLLKACKDIVEAVQPSAISEIRRAIARIDELYFKNG